MVFDNLAVVTVGDDDVAVFPSPIPSVTVARQMALVRNQQNDDRAFIVMDCSRVVAQYSEWTRLMPRVEPYYAVKCNNNPVLLRVLAQLGCGFDCASKGEIEQVLQCGVSHERIIYANPCKTRNYIKFANSVGVNLMTFDNEDELKKIAALHPNADMILRIAVSDPTAVCPLNLKFGAEPVVAAPELLSVAANMGVRVVGISFHVGSGCRDPTAFELAINYARDLFETGKKLGHKMNILDIGGGYPGMALPEITFEKITRVVNEALDKYFPVDCGVRLIAEPGRYFAASAFTLVCNVMAKTAVSASRITQQQEDKDETGFMYYINDGVYGSFNCILYDHFQPEGQALFQTDDALYSWCTIWGPTCDSLDRVANAVRMPHLEENDWVLFDNMGAYTIAAGSEFNGFPRPQIFYYTCDGQLPSLSTTQPLANLCQFSNQHQEISSKMALIPVEGEVDLRGPAWSMSSVSGMSSADSTSSFGDTISEAEFCLV